jgi:hypothetical protein
MAQIVPVELKTATNHAVLTHIENKSAHSAIADSLTAAIKPLGDVQLFCPDWQQYRYVVASTKGVIFGLAIGLNTIAFKLDDRLKKRALTTGGTAYLEAGPDWVSFILFRDDWPKIDLEFWALKAYVFAREKVG